MKNLYFSFFLAILTSGTFCQNYYPFPTTDAEWYQLNWHQIVPDEYTLTNYRYVMTGNVTIENQSYNAVYFQGWGEYTYIGGLREDDQKNIFFYPVDTFIPGMGYVNFPTNTQEYLLYTFNDLYVGKVITINDKEITIVEIDTVVIYNEPRLRYKVWGTGNNGEHWIEGIGSDKEFFSAYSYEFEWQNFVTCFTYDDWPTVPILSPFYFEACEYFVGVKDKDVTGIEIYPNPAGNDISIKTNFTTVFKIEIYDNSGRLLMNEFGEDNPHNINISGLKKGMYFIRCIGSDNSLQMKFIKQ